MCVPCASHVPVCVRCLEKHWGGPFQGHRNAPAVAPLGAPPEGSSRNPLDNLAHWSDYDLLVPLALSRPMLIKLIVSRFGDFCVFIV